MRLHLIVLAAGFATRLYPLTKTCSKPLLEVGGIPLLSRIVQQFLGVGSIHAITVVHNRKFAGDYLRWRDSLSSAVPIQLVDNGAGEDTEGRGATRDLQLALASNRDDSCLGYVVAGGDNVFDFDVAPLVQQFQRDHLPLLVLRHVGELIPKRYSEAVVDAQRRVTSLREKPADPVSPYSAICLYFLPADLPALVDRFLASGGNGDAPGHFMAWLVQHTEVHGARFAGRWFDIGSAETLAEARRVLG